MLKQGVLTLAVLLYLYLLFLVVRAVQGRKHEYYIGCAHARLLVHMPAIAVMLAFAFISSNPTLPLCVVFVILVAICRERSLSDRYSYPGFIGNRTRRWIQLTVAYVVLCPAGYFLWTYYLRAWSEKVGLARTVGTIVETFFSAARSLTSYAILFWHDLVTTVVSLWKAMPLWLTVALVLAVYLLAIRNERLRRLLLVTAGVLILTALVTWDSARIVFYGPLIIAVAWPLLELLRRMAPSHLRNRLDLAIDGTFRWPLNRLRWSLPRLSPGELHRNWSGSGVFGGMMVIDVCYKGETFRTPEELRQKYSRMFPLRGAKCHRCHRRAVVPVRATIISRLGSESEVDVGSTLCTYCGTVL